MSDGIQLYPFSDIVCRHRIWLMCIDRIKIIVYIVSYLILYFHSQANDHSDSLPLKLWQAVGTIDCIALCVFIFFRRKTQKI